MLHRDPKCVYVTDRASKAEVIVLLLGENNIAAQLVNPVNLAGQELGSANGIEVWVNDFADAERAMEVIARHREVLKEKAERTYIVKVECYVCGKVCEFPAADAGTVQTCPHCGEYLEVPELEYDAADPDME